MLRFVPRNPNPTAFPCPAGMPAALHSLLTRRGIDSTEAAEAFLHPGANSLHDPLLLSDMGAAAARVRAAMEAGEAICVYGDYDVDGVSASAILSGWLKGQGANVEVYLPSRHTEGYGLNEAAVRAIARRARLLVTVDCGVTSVELVALAKSLGLDVIVTDHHEPGEALPDCPVVDPLLGGYPFPHLCGAGVAWKLVWALGGEAAAMPWVDIAALATVADVVPLTGENRAIVRMGLDAVNGGHRRPGVEALIQAAGLDGKPLNAGHFGFQLGPRLNAGGRLGSARRSFDLLTAEDGDTARALAEELNRENQRRKDVEDAILTEALEQLQGYDFIAHRAIILSGRDWNPGVIGLAASRLVERYHCPTVLFSDQGDRLTGSCRSIPGVDIHAALTGCAHTILRFGGHKQAAGLTLERDSLGAFIQAMDAWLTENTDPQAYVPVKLYDDELDLSAITPGLIAALEGIQPTGFGNPAPLFRVCAEALDARAIGSGGAHLKLTLAQGGRRMPCVAFGMGDRAEELAGRVEALFVPQMNAFNGHSEPQLRIDALAEPDALDRLTAKVPSEAALQCDFLTEILYNRKIPPEAPSARPVDDETLAGWMGEGPQGTLVVTSDLAAAQRLAALLQDYSPDLCIGGYPDDPRRFNALCVCPAKGTPAGYRRIVLAGAPQACVAGVNGAQVYRLPDEAGWKGSLPDLDAMRGTYRAMMTLMKRPLWAQTFAQLAHLSAQEAGQDDVTAAASLLAMADMGLFELDLARSPVGLRRLNRAKAEPGESAVWQAIQRWRTE